MSLEAIEKVTQVENEVRERRAAAEARGEVFKYDKHCLSLTPEEIQQKLDAGVPYVIRQKIPQEGDTTFRDAIFGDITVENKTLDDQVLIKRDGLPTYNFANVIDDHLMGITHVVRGSEYLSSAPKYNLLYEAFGWEVPEYIHCSPVMRDAHNKMSKRHGDPSYEDLLAQGFLTEAVVNYVSLLGWAPKGENSEREFFTLRELAEIFDLAGISKSPAIFDIEKLKYFNGHYLREMSAEDFYALAEPHLKAAIHAPQVDLKLVAPLVQGRCDTLLDIAPQVDFFDALPAYSNELYCHKKMKTDEENSDYNAAFATLRERFGKNITPMVAPIWDEDIRSSASSMSSISVPTSSAPTVSVWSWRWLRISCRCWMSFTTL